MKFKNSESYAQNLRTTYTKHSETLSNSLNYLGLVDSASTRFETLKGLHASNKISSSELGTAARNIKVQLTEAVAMIGKASDHIDTARGRINRNKAEHLNRLDNSAAVLVALEYKRDTSPDKHKGLKDPIVLGALDKAGAYVSGVSAESLGRSKDMYFSGHPEFVEDIEALNDNVALFKELLKSNSDATKLASKLDDSIEEAASISIEGGL